MRGDSPHTTFPDCLAAWAERTPDAPALLAADATITFAGLRDRVNAIAGALRRAGVRRADRVALAGPTGAATAVACLGTAAWATAAPLNPDAPRRELEFHLDEIGVSALLTIDGDAPRAAIDAARARHLRVIDCPITPPGHAGRDEPPLRHPDRGDVALALHTSGTSSRPKIVPLTHANLMASAAHVRRAFALTAADRCLNCTHLFHIHGLMVMLAALVSGGRVMLLPPQSIGRFFACLRRFTPTWYSAVPTVHQAILDAAPRGRWPIDSSLRFIRSSSAPLRPELLTQLEHLFGAPVIESYGMTEAALQITANPLPPRTHKPGSVGVASGPRVAILDERGKRLPLEVTGEIAIRGPNVMRGYDRNPGANAAAFCRGWFRTGDLGFFDAEGYLFITGRSSDIINRGGEKIVPSEVDRVLVCHPAVASVVTFPVPHPALGEEIAAAVIVRDGFSTSAGELRAFAAQYLGGYKVPARIVIVPSIPTGPTGKYERRRLARQLRLVVSPRSRDAGAPDGTPPRVYVAPRTRLERRIAAIWTKLLGVRVGLGDDFFESGGHSVAAMQILSRVREVFGVDIPLARVFEAPTVGAFARVVEREVDDGAKRAAASGSCRP